MNNLVEQWKSMGVLDNLTEAQELECALFLEQSTVHWKYNHMNPLIASVWCSIVRKVYDYLAVSSNTILSTCTIPGYFNSKNQQFCVLSRRGCCYVPLKEEEWNASQWTIDFSNGVIRSIQEHEPCWIYSFYVFGPFSNGSQSNIPEFQPVLRVCRKPAVND